MNEPASKKPETSLSGRASGKRIGRLIAFILVVVTLAVMFRFLPVDTWIERLQHWVAGLGAWGPVVFGGIYVLATLVMFPGWILTVTAAPLFGLLPGFVIVSLASTTGAAAAFLVARYLARERIEQLAGQYPKFAALDAAIREGDWRVVALLRLSPAIPFNVQNYLYGLTAVNFPRCILASWIAMMPGTFLYVYLGHVAATAAEGTDGGTGKLVLLGIGLVATIAVTVYITRVAQRKLAETRALDTPPANPPP